MNPIAKASGSKGTLYIYDAIGDDGMGGVGEKHVVDALAEMKANGARELEVRISSPGGSVFAGLAIYRAIASWPGPKVAYVDSLAASAASFVMLAADKVFAAPEAMVMVHEAHGFAVGPAGAMEEVAALLRKANDSILSIYASRTSIPEDKLRAYMAAETWFTGAEAKEAGFITDVLEEERPRIAAASDAAGAVIASFKNAPPAVKALAKPHELMKHEARSLRRHLENIARAACGKGAPGLPGTNAVKRPTPQE